MYCTIRLAKTKVLISFAVTAKLICVFVFAYAKIRFSHDAAHISVIIKLKMHNTNFSKFTIKHFISSLSCEFSKCVSIKISACKFYKLEPFSFFFLTFKENKIFRLCTNIDS